jgi:hypothetical protein
MADHHRHSCHPVAIGVAVAMLPALRAVSLHNMSVRALSVYDYVLGVGSIVVMGFQNWDEQRICTYAVGRRGGGPASAMV